MIFEIETLKVLQNDAKILQLTISETLIACPNLMSATSASTSPIKELGIEEKEPRKSLFSER